MKAQLSDGTAVELYWSYDRNIPPPEGVRRTDRVTCTLELGDSVRLVGKATCFAGDQFVKRIGRKLSLKRAVQSLQRQDRSAIWHSVLREVKVC